MTIASLPMYQHPALNDANDRYWALIRNRLRAGGIPAPAGLSRDVDESSTWRDKDLVLSQTCGMPYRNGLHGLVSLVGTPDYGLAGCAPGYYRSAIVVRRSERRRSFPDYADAVFAYNQDQSQSGFAAPYHHAAAHGFWFGRTVRSESHLRSARSVADRTADIAAIDAVTWRLIQRQEPFAAELEVIDWTGSSPGLPYICGLGLDRDVVRAAVEVAIERLSAEDRHALGIKAMIDIPADTYLSVPNPPPGLLDTDDRG